MIVSLGYDLFKVVTATLGVFPLCGFFLFTSRELPVSYIEYPHCYHHIPEPPPTCFSPCFAPLPTPPQSSLCCEQAAIRVSLSFQSMQNIPTAAELAFAATSLAALIRPITDLYEYELAK